MTHTIAIIKNHVLCHRFDIEPRIQEASFEIMKERQMEFDELFGPVWVYFIERKWSVEVWNTLMGSSNTQTTKIQTEIKANCYESEAGEYAASANASNISESNRSGGKLTFKACAIPAMKSQPDIISRMSHAAALLSPSKPRTPLTKERLAQTFANVPGHKRTETIAVASTAPPAIAPHQAARSGRPGSVTPQLKKRSATDGAVSTTERAEKARNTFGGIPRHKRCKTMGAASMKPPTVTPRSNGGVTLVQRHLPPFRGQPAPLTASTPTRRASSALGVSTPSSTTLDSDADHQAQPQPPPCPSSTILPPVITPRTNKSAGLRAAKMEAEAAAAAKKKK
ncbi:hypothetical protein P691DRAFT_796962 [Macrolepiota fuliginosa MF-IS2]|uniref:Nucleoside diphosphate kinase n=1 Tax=Macrolepiota fuliginosa MF-IS2 TaxID=1400762 RepID=A0A9P5X5R6_9AGAR|nr:hypothetical protein P691DRAFT_796962 [Macrolepiota fuliginosa MF-IS2]